MTIVPSTLPLWACLASFLAVAPLLCFRKHPNLREATTFVAGIVKLALVIAMVPGVLDHRVYECVFLEVLPGIPLAFRVDSLGLLFALVASSLWILTSIYSAGYMRGLKERAQTRFAVFFALSLSATLGVAFAANLFTLYVFYEILSMATYPLVTHHQDREARTGGRTYLTYLLGTSVGFVLPATIYCYAKGGSALAFTEVGALTGSFGGLEVTVLLVLFVFGFAKAGVMPFHSWLPNAMVAPTPVSALLHAVAVVKVGVFCILRVVTGVFGIDLLQSAGHPVVITWIAGATILISSLIALTQDNLKRRLAFSTIGQLSYIVLGASFVTALGITGAAMHIATHAFGKITLFFCAGAIYVASGKKYVSEMTGLGRRMPITMIAFLLGSLSIIGLPPFFGAWSKWYLFLAALDAGQLAMVVILIVSSLLNIAYLLPIPINAFFRHPREGDAGSSGIQEAPMACVVPLSITAFLCLALFFFPGLAYQLADLITP